MSMNRAVRDAVRKTMKARGITQEALAEKAGTVQPSIARLLTGKSGAVPQLWQEVLDELELQLVAIPKSIDVSNNEKEA